MADFDPVSYMMGQKAAGGGGGGGSSTLSGLTDVDISNPSNGQTLVYNAASGKWENGAGGGGDMFVTLGTISAATVPMTYNEDEQMWYGQIVTDIPATADGICAGRNLALTINGQPYAVDVVTKNVSVSFDETIDDELYLLVEPNAPIELQFYNYDSDAPIITDVSLEVYAPIPELAVFLPTHK